MIRSVVLFLLLPAAFSGILIASQRPALATHDAITVHCVPTTAVSGDCQDDHSTIQAAVNHADPGETVLVGSGTYPEQVVIDKPLTLSGNGAAMTYIQPATVGANTTSLFSGALIAAIILVKDATGVAVTDLTVNGVAAAFNACSPGYVGIFYRASSGSIENTHVTNIHHPSTPGCQAVLGIFVQSGSGGPGLNSSVAIIDNTVDVYGKNGITANEPGTFVTVTNNIVTGRGATGSGDAAQNGVQIGFGARGRVSGNMISAHYYTPPDYVACGLLFFRAGGGLGRTTSNTYAVNEQNLCTAGAGPSTHSPLQQ